MASGNHKRHSELRSVSHETRRSDAHAKDEEAIAAFAEVLDHGQEGAPRSLVLEASSPAAAVRLAQRAVSDAQGRGYVALPAGVYLSLGDALDADLRDRTLCLIAGAGAPAGRAGTALLVAAAASPRPHVLLSFRVANPARPLVAREAKAVYGPVASRAPAVDPDVERHRRRAERAGEFVRAGRHAAAERLLRDVSAALCRRARFHDAARMLIDLARLLAERGRVADADRALEEAAGLAARVPDGRALVSARTWQAAVRTDAGRLSDAEAICRATLAVAALDPPQRAQLHATLARVLIWQRRPAEAGALDLTLPGGHGLDETSACWIAATAVRVAIACGRLFDAGLLARQLLADAPGANPLARTIALTAYLRVQTASGDLHAAGEVLTTVVALARLARAPLRSVRARLILAEALLRAARDSEAREALRRLQRLSRASTPLMRRALADLVRRPVTAGTVGDSPRACELAQSVLAVRLVTAVHDQDHDRDAVRCGLELLAEAMRTSRIDVVSADAGPATPIVTIGSGLSTRLGERVLEANLALGPERAGGGCEMGVPVRGRTAAAAIVARWPADRAPSRDARELLELAAACIGPRLAAMQAEARMTARASTSVPELVGVSRAITDLRVAIARAAAAPFAVLVEGESGVGKELVARAIHQLSARRERRLCDVNCAALPDELLESELFGHARGAFTGALTDRPGLFEEAHGGTVFLDEIADLSPRGQAKLLRVVQEQEVRRLGETFSRSVDVRIVAAANRDLRAETAAGRFRQDLLYRLDVIRIRIPPLRERPDDVPILAQHFWQSAASRVGTTAILSHGVLAALSRYHWPGNVRELQNIMAALAVAAPGRGAVRAHLLPAAITGAATIAATRLADARAQLERRMIESALARAGGSRTRAARELGISRQGLLKMMARLFPPGTFRPFTELSSAAGVQFP